MLTSATEFRQRYIDETLTRTEAWLHDEGMIRAIGVEAVQATESILSRLYVPNIASVGRRYIRLVTPEAYRDNGAMPILAGFPGETFIPDGHMLRQTPRQREITMAQFALLYDDRLRAQRVVEGYDRRITDHTSSAVRLVTRYDTNAAVANPLRASMNFGPRQNQRHILTTPLWLLTMGDIDDGYTVAASGAIIHEAVHADDYESAGSIAMSALRQFFIQTELRANRRGAIAEQYAITHDMVRSDERADYNRFPGEPSLQEMFEQIRTKYNDDTNPYAVSDALDDELVAARLYPAKYATYRVPLVAK